eukprot:m.112759 g.112759  ORF g.112759 m.112759 type:complete len:55 (-) comp13487_c0_seq3:1113-1277(-)
MTSITNSNLVGALRAFVPLHFPAFKQPPYYFQLRTETNTPHTDTNNLNNGRRGR